MFLGLRTGIYHVSDLQRAKAWYRELLGADPYFDEPFYVGFEVGGFELGLDPDTSDDPSCFVQSPSAWPPGNQSPFPHIGAADYSK